MKYIKTKTIITEKSITPIAVGIIFLILTRIGFAI